MNNPLNRLVDVFRWSGNKLIKPESVSDHVMGMNGLAIYNIPRINEVRSKKNLPQVDLLRLIYKITIHDYGEAFGCDIPRPFKWYDQEFHDQVERVEHSFLINNLDPQLVKDIESAKDETLEGLWVKMLDFVQAGIKICQEANLGNTYMANELPNVISALNDLIVKLESDDEDTYEVEVDFLNDYRSSFDKVRKRFE